MGEPFGTGSLADAVRGEFRRSGVDGLRSEGSAAGGGGGGRPGGGGGGGRAGRDRLHMGRKRTARNDAFFFTYLAATSSRPSSKPSPIVAR
jgi:hypothetical protein